MAPSLRAAARCLRRLSSPRMREQSITVRETAAEHLEGQQSDWAYSKPVVFLDVLWNVSIVCVAVAVLALSRHETPSMPLRLWILWYAFQCIIHMICVCIECRRRCNHEVAILAEEDGVNRSCVKHLVSANTKFSLIWVIIGLYWVSAGGQVLIRDAPQLYWLCIVFVAFDVLFLVFSSALACVIGIAVCCCLPCIIAIAYVVSYQEGATEEDIRQLSKYKFHKICEKHSEASGNSGGIMTQCSNDPPLEHALSTEDAECCICLSRYEDGVELRELPCGHHFHCGCVDKWMRVNATCPLCKFNILKSKHQRGEEV